MDIPHLVYPFISRYLGHFQLLVAVNSAAAVAASAHGLAAADYEKAVRCLPPLSRLKSGRDWAGDGGWESVSNGFCRVSFCFLCFRIAGY